MKKLEQKVRLAQKRFAEKLELHEISEKGLSLTQYQRFLSLQFHLTKDVQRHFLIAASHPDLAHRRSLREFLYRFANEEELHFKLAEKDLKHLNQPILPISLDVKLWKAYFDRLVYQKPFVRLGATSILENIADGSTELIKTAMAKSSFLNAKNTMFLTVHLHEELPHGDQVLDALANSSLDEAHYDDLLLGAEEGTTFYLRFLDWILEEGMTQFSTDSQEVTLGDSLS